MLSKVAALVKNFLSTDADALCLVPGERLYIMRGDAKSVVGREVLSEESFRAVAAELSPTESYDALIERGAKIPYRLLGEFEKVEIAFLRGTGHRPMMTVARAPKPAAVATASPAAAVAPAPSASASTSARAPAPSPTASVPAPSSAPAHRSKGADPRKPAADPHAAARAEAATTAASVVAAGLAAGLAAGEEAKAPPSRSTPISPAVSLPAPGGTGAPVTSDPPRAALSTSALSTTRPIDVFLTRLVETKSSDLHLSSGTAPAFRLHGEIVPQTDIPALASAEVERLLDPILPDENRREFAERNDTDFAYEIPKLSRFRVNVFRDRHGVGAVFRQIPIEILSAKALHLPQAVVDLGALTKGLVLVTGPTGSGKSTTLAAIIDHINETRTDHIITIEDPIEFIHPNKRCLVNQREIRSHTRGFKDALRAALREDPDIVLVGEMRDLETIAIAIETAETGHLVFGTLHTTTAASTVDRIIDQFPEDRQSQIRVMLAESLRGVVAQLLLKKIGGGRAAALEVLLSNNAVANLIRDGKTFQLPSVMQTSKAQGMVLLNDSLLDLVKRGLVEPGEAYAKAADKPGLLSAFSASNIPSPVAGRGNAPGVAAGAGSPQPAAVSR